ncbi:MAG: hypothetical protein IJV03_01280 [Alphaproteobacteria bacterium]|nr:hypothetical protein [Alphaproteobacteria bacterium]
MQIAAKIEYFINRLFRDEITHIEKPKKWVAKYKDIGKRLEGYIVNVTYKYAGKQKKFFHIDYDHLQLISKADAFKAAQNFYLSACAEIKQRKK